MAKRRDYAREYARRISRGQARGLTRQQAAGRPGPAGAAYRARIQRLRDEGFSPTQATGKPRRTELSVSLVRRIQRAWCQYVEAYRLAGGQEMISLRLGYLDKRGKPDYEMHTLRAEQQADLTKWITEYQTPPCS